MAYQTKTIKAMKDSSGSFRYRDALDDGFRRAYVAHVLKGEHDSFNPVLVHFKDKEGRRIPDFWLQYTEARSGPITLGYGRKYRIKCIKRFPFPSEAEAFQKSDGVKELMKQGYFGPSDFHTLNPQETPAEDRVVELRVTVKALKSRRLQKLFEALGKECGVDYSEWEFSKY